MGPIFCIKGENMKTKKCLNEWNATVDKDVELKGTPVISDKEFKTIEDSI